MSDFQKIFDQEKQEILDDYFTFLRFQSISTDPAYKNEVENCCEWLSSYLQKMGLKVEKWETTGHPCLFASYEAGKEAQTLLIYAHYDVQPVDPLNLWTTPPFEPTVRNGAVYARGALDDKGQCFYTVRAIKALLERGKKLNLNLKFLIEGEEECGSQGLHSILQKKKEALRADHILIVDSGIEKAGEPAITLGTRGIVTFTVTLKGSNFDLHSGTHGGIVYNPNRALVEMLGSLHDKEGRVTVPHFYDDVKEFSQEEKKKIHFAFDAKTLKEHFGALPTGGEKGYSPLESAWLRPTLEINGISGGYSGAGFKTVIPAQSIAKLSCRLVPNQDPEKIGHLVKKHLESIVPEGITINVEIMHGKGGAFVADPNSTIAQVMSEAYTKVFKKPCQNIMIGGSIPIAAELAQVSGGQMLLIGVGLAEDQIHAPDEHFGLDRFEQGFLTLCHGIELLEEK